MGLHKLSYNILKDQLAITDGLVCPYSACPLATENWSWGRVKNIPRKLQALGRSLQSSLWAWPSTNSWALPWDCLKTSRFKLKKKSEYLGFCCLLSSTIDFHPKTMPAFIDFQLSMAMGFGLNGIWAPYFYHKFQPLPNLTSATVQQYLNS